MDLKKIMDSEITFADIAQAIALGFHVSWSHPPTSGHVVSVDPPEWLVLQSGRDNSQPFESGFAQALKLGVTFQIHKPNGSVTSNDSYIAASATSALVSTTEDDSPPVDLLNCPFCGSEAECEESIAYGYIIKCSNWEFCLIRPLMMSETRSWAEMQKIWNRRSVADET